jgi:2-polyprenyl-3-methyl-5-hydroxy-6-metoxy-1,4-benzoquinol methylase
MISESDVQLKTTSTKNEEYTRHLLEQSVWWKRILDVQRPYRLHLKRLKLGSTLEIGCGIGRNLINLGKAAKVVGIDHNQNSVGVADSRGLIAFTPEQFMSSEYARPSSFDSLLLSHVAEHVGKKGIVSLLNEYLVYLRGGGRVVIITPQEAGYRSDTTHVEFMDFEGLASVVEDAGLVALAHYSFPLPRLFGKIFKYNEFVMIAQKE